MHAFIYISFILMNIIIYYIYCQYYVYVYSSCTIHCVRMQAHSRDQFMHDTHYTHKWTSCMHAAIWWCGLGETGWHIKSYNIQSYTFKPHHMGVMILCSFPCFLLSCCTGARDRRGEGWSSTAGPLSPPHRGGAHYTPTHLLWRFHLTLLMAADLVMFR